MMQGRTCTHIAFANPRDRPLIRGETLDEYRPIVVVAKMGPTGKFDAMILLVHLCRKTSILFNFLSINTSLQRKRRP